jgi:hypothetical protein
MIAAAQQGSGRLILHLLEHHLGTEQASRRS